MTKNATAEEKIVKEIEETKEEKKPAAKPVKERKKAEKKEAGKRQSKKDKDKDIKIKAIVEYYGKQVDEKDIIASVKKAWTKSGKKISDISTMDLYIKPEENMVYYVINGTVAGSVCLS